MRLVKFLICILLCSSFIACSDDDNDTNPELSKEYLNQSAWKGQFVIKEKDGRTNARYNVGFSFTSEKNGSYTMYVQEGQEHLNQSDDFAYSVDRKKLRITGYAGTFGGDWFVTEIEKDKLTLIQNKETELYTNYLYLERTY